MGASAISKFPQGYAQNASGTAEYSKLIDSGDLATVRGHALTDHDRLNSDLIAALLCQFQVRVSDICDNHDIHPTALIDRFEQVNARFENVLNVTEKGLIIPPEARPLTRMIAREFDAYSLSDTGHSCATYIIAASTNALVYSVEGFVKICSASPSSMISPRFITTTR